MHCDECGWHDDDAPTWAHVLNHNLMLINRKADKIMSDQSHLDADVQALGAGLDAIEAEIAALKTANPAVDFTALDAAVARVQADAPAALPADGSQPPA